MTKKHIFLGSNRICSVESTGNAYYSHSDHLGSSNIITDQNGTQVQLVEYYPFGETKLNQGTDVTAYKFTGKELDESTKLYYYGARYYDPELGRFLTPDPYVQDPSNPQSLNRYTYVFNNPLAYTDPTGNWGWFIGALIGAFIGGTTAAITGGDIGMGILTGAIGGAIFGGIGDVFSKAGTAVKTFAHAMGGMASGGISAAITGGDVGMGMLIGGVATGAAQFLGSGVGFLKDAPLKNFGDYATNLAKRSIIGSIIGGGIAEATGGDFWKGAQRGATTAAIAYTSNHWVHDKLLPWLKRVFAGPRQNLESSVVRFAERLGVDTKNKYFDSDIYQSEYLLSVAQNSPWLFFGGMLTAGAPFPFNVAAGAFIVSAHGGFAIRAFKNSWVDMPIYDVESLYPNGIDFDADNHKFYIKEYEYK